MKTLKIYDPAASCSTSPEGSAVDGELAEFDHFLNDLDKCSVRVERFSYTPESAEYTKEPVAGVLKKKGADALPLIMVDDEVISVGEYPDLGKLAGLLSASKLPFEMPDCTGCRGCD